MHSAEILPSLDHSDCHGQSDDDELVTAAQSGSESAFRELCRRYARRVFISILRIARDHADAEDALQESLMRAFIHIQQFDRRSSFSTWLTKIGINSALMILRKKRRSCEMSFDFAESDENTGRQWEVADIAVNPEQHCLLNEITQTIGSAMSGLPSGLRAVTELRLVHHLALAEIAARLDITVPATKSRLLRARRRIVGALRQKAPSMSAQK
jgi:RNA polymerase sigma-70 factor (ECF subfamily)